MTMFLVKECNTQHGSIWAVATALTENTYNSRIKSRMLGEKSTESFATSGMSLNDVSSALGSQIMGFLATSSFIVVAIHEGSFDKAAGFSEKEKAIIHANELLESYNPEDIRIFTVATPKVRITF